MATTIIRTSGMGGAGRRQLLATLAGLDGSRYVSIEWQKDGGAIRRATINPRDFADVKGDAASPSAQQAVKTRAANNPDLFNCRDHGSRKRAANGGKPGWISIRCAGMVTLKQGDNVTVINFG